MGRIANIFTGQGITLPLQQRKQMLLLDQEFEACQSKVQVLEAENLKLRAEVNPLKQKVERLQQQIEKEKAGIHKMEPVEIEILKAIASSPDGLRSRDLQARLDLSQSRAEHFLGLLQVDRYILMNILTSRYELSAKGNAYIVDKTWTDSP